MLSGGNLAQDNIVDVFECLWIGGIAFAQAINVAAYVALDERHAGAHLFCVWGWP